MYKHFLLGIFALLLISCEDNDESQTKDIDKEGSIEITYQTKHHNDKQDVAYTYRSFWVKKVCIRKDTIIDTIPSLGVTKEWVEDSTGNEKQVDIKKDYLYFVTIK